MLLCGRSSSRCERVAAIWPMLRRIEARGHPCNALARPRRGRQPPQPSHAAARQRRANRNKRHVGASRGATAARAPHIHACSVAAKGCLACALDARGCAPRRTAGAAARAGWCTCAFGRSFSTAAARNAPSLRLEHPPAATDDPPSDLVSIGRRAAAAYAACADACLVLMCGYDLHVQRLTARSLPARARAGWLPGTHTAMALKHTPPVRRPPRPRQRRSRPQPSSAS